MLSLRKVVVSLFFVFVIFFSMTMPVFSETNSTQDSKVEEKREQIRKKIDNLERMERQENNKLNKNQQKLEKNQAALNKSQAQFNEKHRNIKTLQKELDTYLYQYNKRQKATAERIRCIYKTKHMLIFDLLISTDSISQFLDRIYYQNLIFQSDKKKMASLKAEAQNVSNIKRQLESEKKQLSKIIKKIDKENSNIKKIIRKNQSMIDKLQNDRLAYEKAERDLERQSSNLEAMISKTTKNSAVVVTGGFLTPVQGRLSSPYGWRIHPKFKSRKFHTGIDIAAPMGTPIKASNAGKVIYSGWYGGYGRVVILDHGLMNGVPTTTLYAHMSRQKVSVGQVVTRGQIIGLVGSTGYSTGPHLHFEVRINGKPQNPANYI